MAERFRRPSQMLRARSAELRHAQTPAERVLWQRLRDRKLGAKFRRQHPIGVFIADFCSVEHALIIELDGPIHQQHVERDAERAAILEAAGYRILRFTNQQVIHHTDAVLKDIRAAIEGKAALTPCPPLPHAGEGEPITLPLPGDEAVGRGEAALTPTTLLPFPDASALPPTDVPPRRLPDASALPPTSVPPLPHAGEGDRG
jgi:very-short-patch-repair endonuclease